MAGEESVASQRHSFVPKFLCLTSPGGRQRSCGTKQWPLGAGPGEKAPLSPWWVTVRLLCGRRRATNGFEQKGEGDGSANFGFWGILLSKVLCDFCSSEGNVTARINDPVSGVANERSRTDKQMADRKIVRHPGSAPKSVPRSIPLPFIPLPIFPPERRAGELGAGGFPDVCFHGGSGICLSPDLSVPAGISGHLGCERTKPAVDRTAAPCSTISMSEGASPCGEGPGRSPWRSASSPNTCVRPTASGCHDDGSAFLAPAGTG